VLDINKTYELFPAPTGHLFKSDPNQEHYKNGRRDALDTTGSVYSIKEFSKSV
jgi:hypothetical protein